MRLSIKKLSQSIALLSLIAPSHAQSYGIVEAVPAQIAFQGIMSELNASIEQAFSQGNFLVWNAGVQARMALDRWGEVNKDLLANTFSQLDGQQRNFFRNINDVAQKLNASEQQIAKDVQTSLDQVQQIVSDVKFWDGQPAVLRYSPSVVLLARKTPKQLTLSGLNLDTADPKVWLIIDGKSVEIPRVSVTKQSAVFEIPKGLLSADATDLKQVRGQARLVHKKAKWLGMFGTEKIEVTTDLSLALLPEFAGSISGIQTFKKSSNREYTDWKNREFHFSSGSLDEKCDIQTQDPSLDHKIDVDSIGIWNERPNPHPMAGKKIAPFGILFPKILPGEWGRGGSQSIVSKTTEGFGVKLCAKRWADGFPPDTGPGFKHVVYRWREFKTVEAVATKNYPDIRLSWVKDEVVKAEPGSDGLFATISLFSGESRHEIREKLSGKYYNIEFEPKTGFLLFKPQIPNELAAVLQ